MIQRLSVRAIINQDGKALLLKRSNGRKTILDKYELPGGKLEYGEQPEDALRRYLHDDAHVYVQSSQLFDAVTYIDHDDRSIQYGVIVYLVTLPASRPPIRLSGNYSKYKWHTMTNVQQYELTDLTQLLLGIIQQDVFTDTAYANTEVNDVKSSSEDTVIIYSDGGSRGNPGPSAAGYIIINNRQEVLAQGGEYLGVTNNNQTEYQGVRLGLEKALALGYKKIDFRSDSMLVVNQLRGTYRVKNRDLWPVHEQVLGLISQFDRVSFSHVNRQFNQLADAIVNKTLDAQERGDQ